MKLHKEAEESIKNGPGFDAFALKTIFEELIEQAEQDGTDVGQLLIAFAHQDNKFVKGTYVPELWFVVRKVLEDE